MLYQEMDVFTRRKKLQGISVHSVFTWKEKSQGISVDSTNDRNNCTTKKVSQNQTERQTHLLCEILRQNTDFNYPLMLQVSTNDGNNCTTKKVSWNPTKRQTDLYLNFGDEIQTLTSL